MSSQAVAFSIVIPSYNRPRQLAQCLESLASLHGLLDDPLGNALGGVEVVVVNDGGVALEAAIAPFEDRLNVVLINQDNTGPAQARNHGATAAKGEFLVFTDDDCCPATDWLEQIAKHCEQTPEAMIGGQTINTLTDNIYSVASQMIVVLAYKYFNPQPEQAQFFAANNMVFPSQAFLSMGGFHRNFITSEDREICDRWLRMGRTMRYVEAIKIYHAHHLSLASFWKQHYSYGKGAFCYHTLRTTLGEEPFSPDYSFFRGLLTYPFTQLPPHRAVQAAGLMVLSQAASFVGYFQQKQQSSETFSERFAAVQSPLTEGGQDNG